MQDPHQPPQFTVLIKLEMLLDTLTAICD